MRIIDLSSPIDASFWEPDEVVHRVMDAKEAAQHVSDEMRVHFGLDISPDVFPDGSFLTNDHLTLTTHTGTHVDAPSHYGPTGTDRTPRTIDQMPLDWFVRPGMVLDLRDAPTGAVGPAYLEREFDRVGRRPRPFDVVLLHTGADRHLGTPEYFSDFTGLDGPATRLLLDLGVRVIGTDAFSLDAPFPHIIRTYQETGDPQVLWPAHFEGRREEYCQLERLANLQDLPGSTGFTVSCLPVKITGAGAGWSRVVALAEE
ncbi:cyclase family protein [Streptomyces sp. SM11]|uniref:cyclase family protein n=1 Tax=Streptomyces sp. SM11 TaxID=565557 RepID=UPI000CD529B2|nr:cyclase family protein [Streptomyces sp. SM11]